MTEDAIKKMLPKTYLQKHVAHAIHVALTHFKHLEPKMDKYVYNDGETKVLMSLIGTIPVIFRATTFNIPICVWVEENYPQTAPICYVRPTRDMMMLKGNYVSNNGEILLPYLQEWKPGECDLVSLLQVMVAVFGDFPPVCMRPPHPEPEQASCRLQVHKQEEALSKPDGGLYLPLAQEDGQLETNC